MRSSAIVDERRVAFKQGRKLLAQEGSPGPSLTTLNRWATKGLRSKRDPNGPRITLEHYYIGGLVYTSVEAFKRWLKKIN